MKRNASDQDPAQIPDRPVPASPVAETASLQERFEASTAGRWLVSAFLAVTVVALGIWNLPASELRSTGLPVARPYINAAGLTQTWNLFAPDPLDRTREMEAIILYTDGSSVSWRPPQGGPWLAPYRTYRWYAEIARLRLDRNKERWEPFAAWVVRTHDHGGRQPDRVNLVRRWQDIAPPGGAPNGPWNEEVFYTLDLPGQSDEVGSP